MLDPERDRRAAELFSDALALAPEVRAAFIQNQCGDDHELRQEVESLLAVHGQAPSLLERPLVSRTIDEPPERNVGRQLGPYRLHTHIATGGMALVYRAERTDEEFRAEVAVKLIRSSLAHREILARFRTERQILADLQHPNIARLVDGGSTDDGQPYIVMEYVDGKPIDRHCDEQRLPVRSRILLFLQVCEAVQYAHRCRVVHQDLKPGNVLVDGLGRVKLLDFGIARIVEGTNEDGAPDSSLVVGRLLTPRYASPEQLRGEPTTSASDLYSLGVILYELLTGVSPFSAIQPSLPRRVADRRESTPAPPSQAARKITEAAAGLRGGTVHGLIRQLRGDLDAVNLRALSPLAADRYEGVEEFATDLRRFLGGLPVAARTDTSWYRLSKFASRNRLLVNSVLTALLLLSLALVGMVVAFRQAVVQGREARWQAYVNAIGAAESELLLDKGREAGLRLDAAPSEYRGWEWWHLRSRLDQSLVGWKGHRGGVTDLAVAAGGRLLVSSGLDSLVRLWELPSRRLITTYGPYGSSVETVGVDRSGIVIIVGLLDGTILALSPEPGRARVLLRGEGLDQDRSWPSVAVRPDGREFAAGFLDGTLVSWSDRESTSAVQERCVARLCTPVYSPDSRQLALGDQMGSIHVVETDGTGSTWTLPGRGDARIMDLAFSRDGTLLGAASLDHTVSVFDWRHRRLVSRFDGHSGTVSRVEFGADGQTTVSAGADGRLLRWGIDTGVLETSFRGHAADVTALAVTPGGDTLASGDWSGDLRLWRWGSEEVPTIRFPAAGILPAVDAVAAESDGHRIYCATADSRLCVVEFDEKPLLVRSWPRERLRQVVLDDRSGLLVAVSARGELQTYSLHRVRGSAMTDGHQEPPTPLVTRPLGLDFDASTTLAAPPDGGIVATAGDSIVRFWSLPDLTPLRHLQTSCREITDLAFSPNGGWVAVGDMRGTVEICASDGGLEPTRFAGHSGAVVDLTFAPDGTRLATASVDGSVRIWNVPNGQLMGEFKRTGTRFSAVAWSRDGSRLAAGGTDQLIRLCEGRTGRQIGTLHGHVGRITHLEFGPSDAWLVSGSRDGTLRFWTAPRPAGPADPRPASSRGPHPLTHPVPPSAPG